jgi:streptogramin lyase
VRTAVVLLLGWFCVGVCVGGCASRCRDHDGDKHGPGCAAGPDCNDNDPLRTSDCDASVPDCIKTPYAAGCPCLSGETVECYDAPAATEGVGPCHAGSSLCITEQWSTCDGPVLPKDEICNGLDDDCDGVVDEGVLSPCGGCNAQCVGGIWGPPITKFEAKGELDVTANGELTLRRTDRQAVTVWVANTAEGTVSKLDAKSAKELARYRTAGATPIRVAVDHRGDAWVLDQSQHGVATLTKLAATSERCAAHGGGKPVTSQGPGDVLALGHDDCVLASLPVGSAGDDARALAIDGASAPDSELAGNVWVGLAGKHAVVEFDGVTGRRLRTVSLPGFSAYAAAFDPWGVLWLIDRAGLLAHVDLSQTLPSVQIESVPFVCFELEALAIDAQGRLVITGFSCERVITFDPARKHWASMSTPSLLTPRGVAFRGAQAWVAYTSAQLGELGWEPLSSLHTYELAQGSVMPYESIAAAVDSLGKLWVVSASGGAAGVGVATRFDPDSGKVSAQVPVGRGPRAQGDLTGAALGGDFVPNGESSYVFAGCGHESLKGAPDYAGRHTQWVDVHVPASLGPGAKLVVAARWAATQSALAGGTYVTLGTLPADSSPLPLHVGEGGLLEVRLTLSSLGAIGAPRVAQVGVQWRCPGPE